MKSTAYTRMILAERRYAEALLKNESWVKIRFYEEKMLEARRLWDESRSLQGD